MGNLDRQKVLMIFGIALVSAFLMSWFVYAKATGPKLEKMGKMVVAARDMPAGTRLKATDLKQINVAETNLPRNAIIDPKMGVDRVLLFPVNVNEPVVNNKISTQGGVEGLSATIEPGKRAVSVPITDSSGAGGLIQPRSHVDVLFTRTGSMNEAVTTVLLQNVTVMAMGRNTEVATVGAVPGQGTASVAPSTNSRAATLLVTPSQAAKLEFARQQGKISLALRNPLDSTSDEQDDAIVTAEDLKIETSGPSRRLLARGKKGPIPNVRNDDVWKNLTSGEPRSVPKQKEAPKEAPKPRFVVDVFKGDKHVQEVFQ